MKSKEVSHSFDPKLDGKEHINIYSMGKTVCGRMLSPFSYHAFTHPVHGNFKSLEGLYYFISRGCKEQGLRRLHGAAAKRLGRKLPIVKVDDFHDHMRKGIWAVYISSQRITDAIVDQILANDCKLLPFVHYYNYHGNVVVPKGNEWLCEEWEKVRDRVIESMGGTIEIHDDGTREALFPDA